MRRDRTDATPPRDSSMLTVHPISNLLPDLPPDEYVVLRESIRANGQLVPIIVWRGQILDGRHRHRACLELGIEPRLEEFPGDEEQALRAAIVANLRRRHLAPSQVAAIAAECMGQLEAAARQRQESTRCGQPNAGGGKIATAPVAPGKVRDQAAALFGVSPRLVQDAVTVRKAAPHVHQQVKAGTVSATAAARRVREEQLAKPLPPVAPIAGESDLDRLKREAVACLEGAQTVWAGFDRLRRAIVQAGKDLEALARAHETQAAVMDLRGALAAIERIDFCLAQGKPYWVCPACQGSQRQRAGCRCCGGNGWVTASAWELVDPQLKAAMPIQPKKGHRR